SKGQDEVPYEDKSSYKFELDYNFQSRVRSTSEAYSTKPRSAVSSTLLPYVKVLITLTNLPADRYRVKVLNNFNVKVLNRKVKSNMQIIIDMGYANDIKDGITANHYVVTFEDKSRNKLSKIVLEIDKEGNFLVNDQQYGKI
ncbi:MAG: hypothetical protein AAFN93_02210, partial [Bacteroidota bacterium]